MPPKFDRPLDRMTSALRGVTTSLRSAAIDRLRAFNTIHNQVDSSSGAKKLARLARNTAQRLMGSDPR